MKQQPPKSTRTDTRLPYTTLVRSRAVVFTLGRFTGVKGPGLIILIPVIQQMVRADLRTIVHDVPTQDVISHDNVSVRVNAVIYFRIVDPEKSVIQVEDFMQDRKSTRLNSSH